MIHSAERCAADDFTRTCWSMVQRLHAPQPDPAHDALTELAVRYWYPVYAYVCRCGHAPEIAHDVTRAFFQRIAVEARDGATAPSGRFRDWLLQRLHAFLAGDWREFADDESCAPAPPLDAMKQRHHGECAPGDSPEQAFQHSFATEVLARGFKVLQTEVRQTGHLDMYEALEPYLVREPLPGQYAEMSRALGVRPLVLMVALKRLRQRFRELARAELADTVSSAEELAAEQQALVEVLDRKR